jgi:hypothetical protein
VEVIALMANRYVVLKSEMSFRLAVVQMSLDLNRKIIVLLILTGWLSLTSLFVLLFLYSLLNFIRTY